MAGERNTAISRLLPERVGFGLFEPAADGGVGDGDAAFGQPALQLGGAVVLLMEGQQLAPVAFQARAYKPPLAARVVR